MKYYSEKLKKLFDTVKELESAEKEFDKIQAEKSKELEEKKLNAKEVEDAYKHYIETIKESNKLVETAYEKYLALRGEFIKKYGSFHMSYRDSSVPRNLTSNSISSFFNDIFRLL